MRYRNAAVVLPPDLLEEVRKHHSGLLYVPPQGNEERDREILRLHENGMTSPQIAEQVHLSTRRVEQIIRSARGMRNKN